VQVVLVGVPVEEEEEEVLEEVEEVEEEVLQVEEEELEVRLLPNSEARQ